nr:reverse transcriptase domain-containing protein [Tanacetum cinerariifolium]
MVLVFAGKCGGVCGEWCMIEMDEWSGRKRLGDKERDMFAYSNDSMNQSSHSSHRDTKSCYHSSPSKRTEITPKRHHRVVTEGLSESKDSEGGHWKSKSKRKRSSIVEDNLSQPWEITSPELIKRLHDKIPKSVDEMMKVTTTFSEGRRRLLITSGRSHFHHGNNRMLDISKTLRKEASETNKGPSEYRTEKRNASKFYEFHGEVRHTTDECMHLKRKIEEMLIVEKLLHLIKELKQSNVISLPPLGEEDGTEGPMNIESEIEGHFVHRMYVDGGSSLKFLYEQCFNRFGPKVRSQMIPAATTLVEFSGEIIWSLGQISLFVKIGDEEHSTSAWMNFMVVRSPFPYNGIIGRPGVRRIQAVTSTAHEKLKFSMTSGTVTLRSSRIVPLECIMVLGPGTQQPVINQVTKEKIKVAIHPEYLKQTIAIGSTLTEEGRTKLCGLLRQNLNVFAWKPADMNGISCHIAEHRLNIHEGCLPIKQKKKGKHLREIRQSMKRIAHANRTKRKRGTNHLSGGSKGSHQCSPDDEKGRETNTHLLRQPRITRSENKLRTNGKLILAIILSNPKVTRRLLKWSFELGEYDIHYRPRTSVNGQILADLIMKRLEDDPPDTPMKDKEELSDPWVLFTDESSCIDGSGADLIFMNSKGAKFTCALSQVNGSYIAKEPGMIKYLEKVRALTSTFKEFSIKQVPRRENKKADALSKMASTSFTHLSQQVLVEELKEKSIDEKEVPVMEEISHVLWVHHTMIKSSNGETPFSFKYGTKAMISIEIGMPNLRTAEVDMIKNKEALEINLDLLEERREWEAIQEAKSKAKIEKYYNARVRNISFKPGDLVYQNNEASHAEDGGKLRPKWEGPYKVT